MLQANALKVLATFGSRERVVMMRIVFESPTLSGGDGLNLHVRLGAFLRQGRAGSQERRQDGGSHQMVEYFRHFDLPLLLISLAIGLLWLFSLR